MAPRYTYWTIIHTDGPTSFRARDRDSLVPTLKQLQSRDPNAALKWFANGKLWDSEDAAREYARLARMAWQKTRGPEWRPGGEHRDPRARFKSAKPPKRRPAGPGGAAGNAGGGRPASGASPKASSAAPPRPRGPRRPAGGAPVRTDQNGRQRRPYRPTGGNRRGGGSGGGGRT